MNPKEMLQATGDAARGFSFEAWNSLLKFAVESVEAWAGGGFEFESLKNGCVGSGSAGGFCLKVRGAMSIAGPFFHWKGILGATIVDDRIHVTLDVFPYAGEHRLMTTNGKELAEYVLDVDSSGEAKWRLFGWFEDTYGEYNHDAM